MYESAGGSGVDKMKVRTRATKERIRLIDCKPGIKINNVESQCEISEKIQRAPVRDYNTIVSATS